MSRHRKSLQQLGPGAPQPSPSQVISARLHIYAQNHPIACATRGALVAAAYSFLLVAVAAAPSLADPGNIPGWTLVLLFITVAAGASMVGIPLYFFGSKPPEFEEKDPVRFASSEIQASTGALGADREINHLARQTSARLLHSNNPTYWTSALFGVLVFTTVLPVVNTSGPGLEIQNLIQPVPATLLILLTGITYQKLKVRNRKIREFQLAYDQKDGPDSSEC